MTLRELEEGAARVPVSSGRTGAAFAWPDSIRMSGPAAQAGSSRPWSAFVSMPSAEVLAGFLRAHGLQLNAQQRAAAGAVEGLSCCWPSPAAARRPYRDAAGLSRAVLQRPPGGDLTMTYTVAATRDMRNRFSSLFGEAWQPDGVSHHQQRLRARIIRAYEQRMDGTPFPALKRGRADRPCCACCISGARRIPDGRRAQAGPHAHRLCKKIRCWARRSWTCCGRSWTAFLRFTAPISRRCAMPGRWTMTTRWSMPCASCGRSRRSCTNFRRALSLLLRGRGTGYLAHPACDCLAAGRCRWEPVSRRRRGSEHLWLPAPPVRICCCTLGGPPPAQRSMFLRTKLPLTPQIVEAADASSARTSPAGTSTCSPSAPAARPSAISR